MEFRPSREVVFRKFRVMVISGCKRERNRVRQYCNLLRDWPFPTAFLNKVN